MDFKDEKILMGLKIRNIRKQKGFTQEKLSEILNIDISGLSKIENGKCFPSVETIYKIIKKLEISPNELFNKNPSPLNTKEDLIIEKIKKLPSKDKEKVLKIVEIIRGN